MNERLLQFKKKADRISVALIARFLLLLSRLMPYGFGVRLGGMLGVVAYYVLPRERRRALEHLERAFRDKDAAWIKATARRSFSHLGKSVFELMMMTPSRLAVLAESPDFENLKKAHDLGKGVIFVTGHIGNWELMGAAVAARYPLSVVAAPVEPERVNDIIVALRGRFGTKVILRGRQGASRDLIRIFKENRVLGVLIDQDTDVEGAFVDFMGMPAWTPTAAASMALKFGAPVIFGYVQRTADNRHLIRIEGPLELIRTGNEDRDVIENTAMLTKKIESCILRNPEQWVWMHRRWRKQP